MCVMTVNNTFFKVSGLRFRTFYIQDAIFVYLFPFRLIGFCLASRSFRSTHWQHARCLFLYLYTYLPVCGLTTFVKHDDTSHARGEKVSTNDARREFQDQLISSGFKHYRINFVDKLRFIIDPKFLSMEKFLMIEKPQHSISIRCGCEKHAEMGFRRDCFVLFSLPHFVAICVMKTLGWLVILL